MDKYQEMGICLEYYRVKNNYTINEMINKEHKICDYKTYQRVINGKCKIDSIYEQLFERNNIYYDKEKKEDDIFKKVIETLYIALQYLRVEECENDIKKMLEPLYLDEHWYPYTIFNDFINDFIAFYSYKIEGSMRKVELYKSCLTLFSYKLQVCFYEYYYQNVCRLTLDTEKIAKVVSNIPDVFKKENNVLRMLMESEKFQFHIEECLEYAQKLENKSLAEENANIILLVYQTYHGVFNYLGEKEKANHYIQTMYERAIQNKGVSQLSKERALYYVGTSAFEQYNLKLAKIIIDELVENKINKYPNLLIIYLYLNDLSNIEKIKPVIERLRAKNLRSKIIANYFAKKMRKESKEKLKTYILEKVIPILSKQVQHEYWIFLDELYKMGYYNIYNKMWEDLNDISYSKMWRH